MWVCVTVNLLPPSTTPRIHVCVCVCVDLYGCSNSLQVNAKKLYRVEPVEPLGIAYATTAASATQPNQTASRSRTRSVPVSRVRTENFLSRCNKPRIQANANDTHHKNEHLWVYFHENWARIFFDFSLLVQVVLTCARARETAATTIQFLGTHS